ncbi:hypothetical protein [Cryptosporangium aurantiacum]|uniref:Uncharacterized protein n=1 Tax=Cryptosporangium aurantiacum TaxID=134849 RepID=A0A1M7RKK4_9ACTN|nr:hypothetical protein [Cryptosporangium aurantiacum]SHN46676.1 hypothetical protein SAMN05443668_11759 [Cryptosporangium aurantiacum]
MAAPRSRGGVDRGLAALNERRQQLAAALVAMDTEHGGLAHLRSPGLRGATAEVAERVRVQVDALWAGFAALGTVLDAAARLRTSARWPSRTQVTEVSALLEAPIADESLPGAYRVLGAAALCYRLDEDCRQIRGTLTVVDERVAALTALLGRLESALTDADAGLGVGAGPAPAADAEVDAHRTALRELRARATADPLGTDPAGADVQRLVAAVEKTAARLARQAALRAGYPARRAAVQEALDRLAAAESAARDVYALATEKIHDPRLPAATDSEPALRRRLATLERLDVVALDTALPALERSVREALDHAGERHRFADGLLARREELRGRLEAYRAKAARLGLIERSDVLAGYSAARALLWTAPCDLPAATRAVVAYQRSLLESPGGGAA